MGGSPEIVELEPESGEEQKSDIPKRIAVALVLMIGLLIFALLLSVLTRDGGDGMEVGPKQASEATKPVATPQLSGRSFEEELVIARRNMVQKKNQETEKASANYRTYDEVQSSNRSWLAGASPEQVSDDEAELSAARLALKSRSELVTVNKSIPSTRDTTVPTPQTPTQRGRQDPQEAAALEAEKQRLRARVKALSEEAARFKRENGL